MTSWLRQSVTSWLSEDNARPADRSSGRSESTQADSISVTDLWIFPVKSCRGIQVQSARVLPRGLEYDREFVICDEATHKFLTARTIPKMILIETAIDFGRKELTITVPANDDTGRPRSSHVVSLERPERTADIEDDPRYVNDVSIWKHSGLDGFLAGSPDLIDALSDYMGRRVLLIQKGFELREAGPEGFVQSLPGAKFAYDEHPQVGWADEYPVLMVSKASLRDLDERVQKDRVVADANKARFDEERWRTSGRGIEAHRFRGNIVIDGPNLQAWDEDSWAELELGGTDPKEKPPTFIVAQRCGRCQLPSVDPDTAIRDPVVPDMFMKKDRLAAPSMPTKLCFGIQCVPVEEHAFIRVGEMVKVVRRYDGPRPEDSGLND